MATSKAKKQYQLTELETKLKDAKGVAFVKFDGATVMDVQQARRDLRAKGMTYSVLKKTLMSLAAKNTDLAEFDSDQLDGSVAIIVSQDDEIAPAAAIKALKKEHFNKETKTSKFDFAGAVFEGKFLDSAATATLAETPSREESLGAIVGALNHGVTGIHAGLTHGLRGIATSLDNAEKFSTAS
jgi:large subunit ribosomal protein L10